ncbi:MAG: flagellar hook assembly protein FlgD [Hyphomonadaceae bacterium]|nr:flagellar hook assembly protein FlgD [Hyphomonadaceae bacterium]
MTTIPGVTNTPSATTDSRTSLAENYDTFLVLLTAQLQNQDPLAPMDSTQFTQQLVQFSQVEQQIRTNEQLEGLVAQYQAASAGAALSYLGKDAIIAASDTTYVHDETKENKTNWAYDLPSAADSVTIKIKDASGRVVYTTTGERGEGQHLFTWDGTTDAGGIAPTGVYTLSVEAKNTEGAAITPSISVRETILGVDFSGTTPLIMTGTGTRGLDTVRSVLEAS